MKVRNEIDFCYKKFKMNKIEIPLSKTKINLIILGSVMFVAAGLWMLFYMADQQTRFDPVFVKIVGIFAVLFFGATGILSFVKLFDGKPGLTIDENGIINNSSGVSNNLIEWNDVTGIRTEQVMSTKFVLIDVSKPEKYIERANKIKGKMMMSNLKMYGTPLSIASTSLKCSFDELETLIKTEFDKHKVKKII